jgi:hypothetical protein
MAGMGAKPTWLVGAAVSSLAVSHVPHGLSEFNRPAICRPVSTSALGGLQTNAGLPAVGELDTSFFERRADLFPRPAVSAYRTRRIIGLETRNGPIGNPRGFGEISL